MFELKASIFVPFSQTLDGQQADDSWRRVLRGKGTLGESLHCLLQSNLGNHRPAKLLASWLRTNTPKFAGFVARMRYQAVEPLWRLRGEAQHGSVDETEARRVYELASKI